MEEKHQHGSCALHLVLKITKLALDAAAVAAAFCIVHEVHKVHKAIGHHHEGKHKLI